MLLMRIFIKYILSPVPFSMPLLVVLISFAPFHLILQHDERVLRRRQLGFKFFDRTFEVFLHVPLIHPSFQSFQSKPRRRRRRATSTAAGCTVIFSSTFSTPTVSPLLLAPETNCCSCYHFYRNTIITTSTSTTTPIRKSRSSKITSSSSSYHFLIFVETNAMLNTAAPTPTPKDVVNSIEVVAF